MRHTSRLRLEPIGPRHAGDLWLLHQDEQIAQAPFALCVATQS